MARLGRLVAHVVEHKPCTCTYTLSLTLVPVKLLSYQIKAKQYTVYLSFINGVIKTYSELD